MNNTPVVTAAQAEARAAKAVRLWAEWEQEFPGEAGEESRRWLELEFQRRRAQGVAVAVAAAQSDFAVAVELKLRGLADEEAVREARARVWREESRKQQQELALAAASTAVTQRLVQRVVHDAREEIRKFEVAPVRQWLQEALVERSAWRRKAKDNARAAEEARWAAAGARAQAAAALKAAAGAGPIVVD